MAEAIHRLFLLDGMALIYRAHFAFIHNPIRNSQGVNTSALYGFTNTLLQILESEHPTHLGVAFDTSAPTPRHVLFPAYKAQRDAMPEELAAAIPSVKDLCRAFHLPILEIDGFEADDLIGTLARRAERDGSFHTFMVTPDKDFAQLVSPAITMWKPGRKGSEREILDLPATLAKWDIQRPDQVIDILGLMGDASDNIPGVPGIGEKTAQKLIAEFDSVENLIANVAKLKGKLKERIEQHADQAILSKHLATIITDAPVDVPFAKLLLEPRDDAAVKELFNRFEFRTLTRRLFNEDGSPTPPPAGSSSAAAPHTAAHTPTLFESFKRIGEVPHTYHLADTPEKQAELFALLAAQPRFCFDIETTSLDRFSARLLGVAFCWAAHDAWFLPVTDLTTQLPALAKALGTPAEKIGHNLKYDLGVLLNHGICVKGPLFDTMLVHQLIAPDQRHGMDYLSECLLGYTPITLADLHLANQAAADAAPASAGGFDDLFAFAHKTRATKEIDVAAIPLARLAEYAAEDADVTWQIAEKLRPQLLESGQQAVYENVEAPLLPVLVNMEMEGISIDIPALGEIAAELQIQITGLAASIATHAGRPFNLASPKQLGEILFTHLGLADKAKKTKTGQFKTDEATLATLEGKHPIITDILAWRESTKLKSTYLDALPTHLVPRTGRIHTHFHQLVAATGRLASTDPNLQNIPIRTPAGRQIRKAFIPRVGFTLLSCDYSQIELRVMAALANDASMIDAFRRDLDIHAATAAKVFGVAEDAVTTNMRRTAKMVNFGIIYGISAFGLSQRLGIPRTEAAAIIDAYFREYPAIREFMENTIAEARANGYVATLTGRRRYFPDITSGNQNIRGNAERAAINTPIQGTAADMIKLAMVKVADLLRARSAETRMLLQVHDELVFDLAYAEAPELVPQILEVMSSALPLPHAVPVKVEHGTGANWLAAH
jgi:DNA polymerase-1